MTISVLMSVYRNERPEYLNEAMKSVWTDQTLKPSQIILVEDGPLTDELEQAVNLWQERLGNIMTVHRNETNQGLTKSLNTGLRYVTSDLVARMDSDDLSDPMRFERQAAYLSDHPDVTIVGGAMQEFSSDKGIVGTRHYPENNDEVLRSIHKASPLAHPTVTMRRKMFDDGLRYNERFRTSQDIALWFDAICAGYKIGNVEEVTLYFRRDDTMFRRRSRAKAWNEFLIYMNGVKRLHGFFTPKYIFPISRLIFRLMPRSIVKMVYDSRLRRMVVDKRHKKPAA